MNISDFGTDFKWGVSTASFQTEGAVTKDGRGPSIWDSFSKGKNRIANNDNADKTCDFYSKYAEDIYIMHQLGIPNFRFSIAWSRIFPNGYGSKNQKGIDFYNKVINLCLEFNIEPWITLYHWDLPQSLEDKGGWTNREIVSWFEKYVECCVKHFGDRVRHWIILNEPMVFTGAGYFLGIHAPGKRGLSNFFPAAHHAALCQAHGGRIVRSMKSDSVIGTTFSFTHIDPLRTDNILDIKAASKIDTLMNKTLLEPLLGRGYPFRELPILEKIQDHMKADDEKNMSFDMDFIGLQAYTREKVTHSTLTPVIKAKIIKANERNSKHTLMNWEIYPRSISYALERYNSYPEIRDIIITENGAAFNDEPFEGKVFDIERIKFFKDYIREVLEAKKKGLRVSGYFVWTLMDNFEWAEGFQPRFGLVYVDFTTNKRIIKESGKWFASLLESNRKHEVVRHLY